MQPWALHFLGMATAFGANPAIVAGAVISGALFGDKMSPLSDTTSIAASLVGVDLFDHIKKYDVYYRACLGHHGHNFFGIYQPPIPSATLQALPYSKSNFF